MAFLVEYLGGKVLDAALDDARRRIAGKRLEKARRILVEELEFGNATLADTEDVDEAAAMVFEFADAAMHGTARRNLRMLAQILAGALVTPPVYADEFLRWSRMLSDLSNEEIIVLAEFYKEFQNPPPAHPAWTIFKRVADRLSAKGVVRNGGDLESVMQGLSRTGLFIQQSGATGGAMKGATIYEPSIRLSDLMRLINIETVLAEPVR